MENFQRFIRIGEDRINAEEIVSYGISTDEDDERYLYLNIRTGEDTLEYYEYDVDFELEEKLDELDGLFLIRQTGYVDFDKK